MLNPSLENYSQCPSTLDEIKFATYWNGIDSSWSPGDTINLATYPFCLPEYCNKCSSNVNCCSVPANARFFQYPHTGDGMAEVQMFFDESFSSPNKRDYLQGRLYTQLTAGRTYCVTFYANFEGANGLAIASGYAVDHIGAYLDDGSIDLDTGNSCGQPHPSIIPQVYTTSIITDSINWTEIQGSFVATGTEKFITIGNFFDKAHTSFIALNTISGDSYAVYLIDDVSVIESDAVADAGLNKIIGLGDTVKIGTDEEGMPCTWYKLGDITPIGYSGGIFVHPDTTTAYVVEMDLCGNVTRDTVIVTVWPAGVAPLNMRDAFAVYPNPVHDMVTIENRTNEPALMEITDVAGRTELTIPVNSRNQTADLQQLSSGLHFYRVLQNGIAVSCGKVVKE